MSDGKKWFEKISWFEKIKNIKHFEIIIAVIFGIIIFLIYLSSTNSTQNNTQSTQTEFETRLSSILDDIEGAGKVSVFVNTNENDVVTGIIVVASGASQIKVKLDMLKAIQTVLSVPTANIEIIVGNK